MKCKHFILILLLSLLTVAEAVENRPVMRRACLNRLDSTLDLLWFRPTDNCGSFTSFSLYGRDNSLSVYQWLGAYTDFSLNQLSIKLPNLKNWEFFLVYNKACNGTDSIFSDTLSIDITPPSDSQLDSVSVDLLTQKTLIGWSTNTSPDVKGYIVYHVTATNAVIASPTSTFYHDLGPRSPGQGTVQYSVAATDSCNNSSLISAPHQTIFLGAVSSNCNKTIRMNWSNYIGWPVESYQIFLKINNGNYSLVGSVVSNITQFTYNFQEFGSTYCFYIRALKLGGGASSSSNQICVPTSGIVSAHNSYVAKASVQNNRVELTLITENGTSLQKINVYKAEGNGGFNLWQSIPSTGGVVELTDLAVRVNSYTFKYYFTTEGPCNLIFDTSQVAQTILLNVIMNSPGDQDLFWTPYNQFIKSTEKQEVLLSDNPDFNKSSPWNILQNLPNNVFSAKDLTNFGTTQEQICYCIRAIENNPNAQYNRKDSSYSNIVCLTADPIVFFPNAIQVNGYNTVFFPKGTFLDYSKSSFQIYNRWGEIIFETNDIQTGWDGRVNGEFVPSDVYAYKAIIVGINGKTLYFDGTITVLK